MAGEIYFDNNATTRVLPEVAEAMLPFLTPTTAIRRASIAFGSEVGQKVAQARAQIAALIGAADPIEVIFTSCGTEGDNAAIRGMLEARPDKRHIVTTQVEHPAVLGLCQHWRKKATA
jgi:cysteine desulfurase